VELALAGSAGIGAGGLSLHVNKVDHVTTVERVAARLGESVDFIHNVALEMDTEDGVIWVHGIGDDGVLAFTDRAGPGCLDSSPRILSGSLPGFAERGAFRFCRGVGRA
jgi:hypothetical protein